MSWQIQRQLVPTSVPNLMHFRAQLYANLRYSAQPHCGTTSRLQIAYNMWTLMLTRATRVFVHLQRLQGYLRPVPPLNRRSCEQGNPQDQTSGSQTRSRTSAKPWPKQVFYAIVYTRSYTYCKHQTNSYRFLQCIRVTLQLGFLKVRRKPLDSRAKHAWSCHAKVAPPTTITEGGRQLYIVRYHTISIILI